MAYYSSCLLWVNIHIWVTKFWKMVKLKLFVGAPYELICKDIIIIIFIRTRKVHKYKYTKCAMK